MARFRPGVNQFLRSETSFKDGFLVELGWIAAHRIGKFTATDTQSMENRKGATVHKGETRVGNIFPTRNEPLVASTTNIGC